jgi:hypothetical protein
MIVALYMSSIIDVLIVKRIKKVLEKASLFQSPRNVSFQLVLEKASLF